MKMSKQFSIFFYKMRKSSRLNSVRVPTFQRNRREIKRGYKLLNTISFWKMEMESHIKDYSTKNFPSNEKIEISKATRHRTEVSSHKLILDYKFKSLKNMAKAVLHSHNIGIQL